MPRRLIAFLVAALAVIAVGAIVYGPVTPGGGNGSGPIGSPRLDCDVTVDPGKPIDEVVDALRPGQTACLRAGVHSTDENIEVSAPRVTLSSYPGETATLEGRLWISEGADGVEIKDLILNGRNPDDKPSPTVNANDVRFRGNEVTNDHTAICFVIGDDEFGESSGTVIERNRIHSCGELPATNHDHGIYVAHAERTVIRDNVIHSNADRGIQLYPDADGSVITANVIDGNGQGIIFAGNGEKVSENNLVEANLITNSQIRFNVESSWPDDVVGEGNIVRNNCIFGGERDGGDGGIHTPPKGFELSGNVIADPLYIDREDGDFRLEEESPCADLIEGGR